MLIQDGLVPPLHPEEASGIILGSEQILKDYANKASLTANDVIALIENVLHNPNFNADDVDTDMLKRLANSINRVDLEIISMIQEGDGAQKLELFKRPVEKVFHMRHSIQYRTRYRTNEIMCCPLSDSQHFSAGHIVPGCPLSVLLGALGRFRSAD